ncbi:transporter substrate-binding domain-containing protein [Yimella sp. cx-51]|nr:transporter substrate-binding domain-containing protein [Yimella sp. cx-51]MBC9955661.1 transporter substrate-binding domain-containing protein [Yimella sp. cx-51]QTH37768.1 transporter substrate-binding domain-containing protein [Yimella sp. cx-51]
MPEVSTVSGIAPSLCRVNLSAIRTDLAPDGVLHASINLGNPVLAQGDSVSPSGVTVDLARQIAGRLDVPVEFVCFDAARKSFEALVTGAATLGFMAIEPARADQVGFTKPYALIEGVYVVPTESALRTVADVDAPGVRIGVKEGSAYDLFLTRTLEHAELVRGAEGVDVYLEQSLEAGAGIRQPATTFVDTHDGQRLIDEAFMQIRQAVAVPRSVSAETLTWVTEVVEELKADGFVAQSLERSGQGGVRVAPAAQK